MYYNTVQLKHYSYTFLLSTRAMETATCGNLLHTNTV